MTKEEVQKLKHGVYKLYWDTGGYSLASVGGLHNGDRWFACSNWTSKDKNGIIGTGEDWNMVIEAKLIKSR